LERKLKRVLLFTGQYRPNTDSENPRSATMLLRFTSWKAVVSLTLVTLVNNISVAAINVRES
jgi:hypothetical protein